MSSRCGEFQQSINLPHEQNLPAWCCTLERTQSKVLLNMLECTTRLGKRRTRAEGTNKLVYDVTSGAERHEHLSWNRAILVYPLLTLEYCFKAIEEPHVDCFIESPLYRELVLGVQRGEGHCKL